MNEQSGSSDAIRSPIGVVVGRFPRIDETYILREINELERLGQPVLVVPMMHGSETVVHEEAKPWLRRALHVPFFSAAVLGSNLVFLTRQPLRYLRLLLHLIAGTAINPGVMARTVAIFPKCVHLARILPRLGVKHLHAHYATHPTTMAYIIASLSDLTFSFTVHGPDVFVQRLLLPQKISRSLFVRSVSTFNMAFISGLYPQEARGKIHIGHIGLNPDVYESGVSSDSGDSPTLKLLSVGALSPNRGFSFLVDAVARLKRGGVDVDCTIIGDGRLRGAVERLISHSDLIDSVRILGAQPQHEVARLMRETDVFVLPSVIALDGQMDGIPVSLMEAMAAGKPVVASAVSGIPELVQDGVSGMLVDATHSERVADVVKKLAEHPELRRVMGNAGRERVRRDFELGRTTMRLLELLDQYDRPSVSSEGELPVLPSLAWAEFQESAVAVRQIFRRDDSHVAELTIANERETRDVILKQQRSLAEQSRGPLERALNEYQALTMLHRALSAEGDEAELSCSVPRVLYYDAPRGALVMEVARGTSLEVVVREFRNRGLTGRLRGAVEHVGIWLQRMQQQTRKTEDGRHILTAMVVLALNDLELVSAADPVIRAHRDELRRRLHELEVSLSVRPLPVVGRHGDFWPGNIFVATRSVDVIDFEGYREGLPIEDVAQFLLMLELYFSYPLLRGPFQGLRKAFLKGYAAGDVDSEALTLFTTTTALQVLARNRDLRQGPLKARWRRRVLRAVILRSLR